MQSDAHLLAILFAHNAVEIWDSQTKRALFRINCDESCILYSGALHGPSLASLEIASGTVFNQVLHWKYSDQGRVFRRLSGHKGAIHGVLFDNEGNHILSCSDDRSIRIWDRQGYALFWYLH